MKRTYVVAGVGILLLAAGAGVLALYAPASAVASSPIEPAALEGSYAVSETLWTDGTEFSSREVSYDAETGEGRTVIAFQDVTLDTYTTSDGETYTKRTLSDRDRFLEVVDAAGSAVIAVDEEARTLITNHTDDGEATMHAELTVPQRLMGGTLDVVGYERTYRYSVDGTDVFVYEPRTGWFAQEREPHDADTAVYVSEADGELHVDSSGAVRSATVTYEATHAETWLEYLTARGESFTTTYEYEFEARPEVTTPEWVDDVRT